DSDDEGQRREFMAMQLCEGARVGAEFEENPRLGGSRLRGHVSEDNGQGFRKDACAPLSPKASGLRPDRFRHPPASVRPAIAPPDEDATGARRCRGQAPPCCPRIAANVPPMRSNAKRKRGERLEKSQRRGADRTRLARSSSRSRGSGTAAMGVALEDSRAAPRVPRPHRCGQALPVEPNPPPLRPVSSSWSTSLIRARKLDAITNWATRMPRVTVNGSRPRFTSRTWISPR